MTTSYAAPTAADHAAARQALAAVEAAFASTVAALETGLAQYHRGVLLPDELAALAAAALERWAADPARAVAL